MWNVNHIKPKIIWVSNLYIGRFNQSGVHISICSRFALHNKTVHPCPEVSVTFLMVVETNSIVGYHLMTEGHSVQLGV